MVTRPVKAAGLSRYGDRTSLALLECSSAIARFASAVLLKLRRANQSSTSPQRYRTLRPALVKGGPVPSPRIRSQVRSEIGVIDASVCWFIQLHASPRPEEAG